MAVKLWCQLYSTAPGVTDLMRLVLEDIRLNGGARTESLNDEMGVRSVKKLWGEVPPYEDLFTCELRVEEPVGYSEEESDSLAEWTFYSLPYHLLSLEGVSPEYLALLSQELGAEDGRLTLDDLLDPFPDDVVPAVEWTSPGPIPADLT